MIQSGTLTQRLFGPVVPVKRVCLSNHPVLVNFVAHTNSSTKQYQYFRLAPNMDLPTIFAGSPAMHRPQDGSLGSLPLELQRQAFENLETADIKSVRLLNQHYNEVASPYLMHRVFLAARPKTMAIFKEIIEHAVFRNTIREIVFDASVFADGTHETNSLASPARFHGVADEDLEEDTDDELDGPYDEQEQNVIDEYRGWLAKQPESNEITQALEHHQTMVVAQQTIIEQEEDLRCLEHAGRLLPKLQSICYTDWHQICAMTSDWYSERGPLSWDLIPMACPPSFNERLLITRPAVVTRPLSSVLQYVLRGGATIVNLKIDVGGRPEFQVLALLNKNKELNLMPNITRLDLSFGASAADSKLGTSNPLKVYSRLLAHTNDLRVLRLNIINSIWRLGGPSQNKDSVDAIKSYLLPKISLQHLHTLELDGEFYVTPDILLHLLDRHAATLQHLRLYNTCLERENATWPEVFCRMRDTLKVVKSIDMNYLYDLSDEGEFRGWSLDYCIPRTLIQWYCRIWIVSNGELDDKALKFLELSRDLWPEIAKIVR